MAFNMEVRLVPHDVTENKRTPTGTLEVTTCFEQFQVFVHSEALATRNKDKKLLVGYIGKQPGANFCPINAFYEFYYPQQQWIADEAKRLHGNAATEPHIELPPPEPDGEPMTLDEVVEAAERG